MDFALFKTYDVIFLPIDAAIYVILQASHTLSISYCTAHVKFDHTELRLLPIELTSSCLRSREIHLRGGRRNFRMGGVVTQARYRAKVFEDHTYLIS